LDEKSFLVLEDSDYFRTNREVLDVPEGFQTVEFYGGKMNPPRGWVNVAWLKHYFDHKETAWFATGQYDHKSKLKGAIKWKTKKS
jgi:hypothetical protein